MATVLDEPATVKLTAEEFLELDSDRTHGFELIDGHLREKAMGAESSELQGDLLVLLKLWARAANSGRVFDAEGAYRCFPGRPNRVRKPDVSFVRAGRLPGDRAPRGFIEIAPDFAAEVISPTDRPGALSRKLADYSAAGVPLVWVLFPEDREIHVHRPGEPTGVFTADDELAGDPVLPGFRVRVGELLPPPAPDATP